MARSRTGAEPRPTGIGLIASWRRSSPASPRPPRRDDRRRADPRRVAPAPPTATGTPGRRSAQRRHPEPRLGPGHAAQVLLLRRPLPQPPLLDRKRPAAERPPHRRRRRRRRSHGQLLPQRHRPRSRRQGPLGRARPRSAGRRRTAATRFRIVPQAGAATPLRAPRRAHSSEAPPISLGFDALRLRLPAPRRARLRRRRGAVRRRPLRPHPRGPGRDGQRAGCRSSPPAAAGSSTPATRAPPATTSSSTARAPATTWPTCT